MTYIKFAAGVKVPRTVIIACAAVNAANQIGLLSDLLVTSGNDRVHMQNSKHYTDEALDFRTKTLTLSEKTQLKAALEIRLGPEYQVIQEDLGLPNEHLHVEFDPHK